MRLVVVLIDVLACHRFVVLVGLVVLMLHKIVEK